MNTTAASVRIDGSHAFINPTQLKLSKRSAPSVICLCCRELAAGGGARRIAGALRRLASQVETKRRYPSGHAFRRCWRHAPTTNR